MPWDLPTALAEAEEAAGMGDAPYPAAPRPFPGLFLWQRGTMPIHDRAGSHLRTWGNPGAAGSIQQRCWLG